ncbi:MAG: TerC family protein [Deltaproteobacteria bacterium]|nr:TerC family protein [Deltaproteobacteria bacterium]
MDVATIGTPALWIGFTTLVLALLALDLGVFHRDAHPVGFREALLWTAVWIGLAAAFNVWLAASFGAERGLEFLTGYLIEKALAVDNIFVFLLIFSAFAVPAAYVHRVLFWGILGALVMRALFIVVGAALLERFHWVMYLFGAFLVITGAKLLFQRESELHPERNPIYRLFARWIPSVASYQGPAFVVRHAGRLVATPLLLVLLCVETSDLVFAVDSIPAIFAVTKDPFIVYTSNVFAILGLRSMFFLLAGVMDRFHYLKVGLALVLAFVGTKMLLANLYAIPIGWSLATIFAILATAIAASWWRSRLRALTSRC